MITNWGVFVEKFSVVNTAEKEVMDVKAKNAIIVILRWIRVTWRVFKFASACQSLVPLSATIFT